MDKYLYGASVQGIQSFIFETNKLKEIVGASELVEQICTTEFAKFCKTFDHEIDESDVIMRAAGNIKYMVDEETAKNIVSNFPKHVSNFAPGITISQAIVKLSNDIKKDIDELEIKLKTQRNKAEMPVDIGSMGVERARKTGKPTFDFDKDGKHIDRGTTFKQLVESKRLMANFLGKKESEIRKENIPSNINKITGSDDNSWLAIIHADGNGLGNILQNLANSISSNQDAKEVFKTFSVKLEEATNEAAQIAFREVVDEAWEKQIVNSKSDTYPMRPVVLGGDDLTVIIRADLAYKFTVRFLTEFETMTKEKFTALNKFGIKDKYLTACAGIAYIKTNYPFHYGIGLAESLTSEAKKFSKSKEVQGNDELPPSSLSFYKVQASFIEDLKEMKKRTHCAQKSNVRFDYGPYLIHKNNGHPYITELDDLLKVLKDKKTDKSKGVSKLRQWISELYDDSSKAEFMRKRIISVNKPFAENLNLQRPFIEREIKIESGKSEKRTFTIYKDLIDLHNFKIQGDENKI